MKYTRFCFQEKSKLRLLFWIHSLQNIFRLPGLFLWQEKYPSHDIMESWQRRETFYFKNRSFLHYNASSGRLALHLFSGPSCIYCSGMLTGQMYPNLGLAMITISNFFLWSLSFVFLSRHHPDQMSQVSRFKSYSRQTQTPDIWHLWTLTFVTPC